jgi:hypothetical protein
MDRIALILIASGLGLILAIVTAVLGGGAASAANLSTYAAAGCALSGAAIVVGLAILERRAFAAKHTGRPALRHGMLPEHLANGAA